jgi:putative transposase
MIEPDHPQLSVVQQCKLLSIARSSFYYTAKGETAQNLDLMRRIDEQFLETPFFGVRQMTWHLRNGGHLVNETRIRRLMRLMGLMPIYQKPNTNRPAKGHKTYPYLLKGLRVDRPNQVWCADITYLPPLGRLLRNRLPGSECGAGSCIWSPSWTGIPGRSWPGASRTRWRPTSASRR